MRKKWISMLMAVTMLLGLTVPALGSGEPEAPPPAEVTEAPPPAEEVPPTVDALPPADDEITEDVIVEETVAEDPAAEEDPAMEAPIVEEEPIAEEAPAGEESTDCGIMTVSNAPMPVAASSILPTGGVRVAIDGPIDPFIRFYFSGTGGGMYDNHYFYAPSLGLQHFDSFDDQGNGEYVHISDTLPSQFSVYPGTELVLELDPAYNVSIDSGKIVRDSYFLGDLGNGEWGIDERIVNIIAPESGSLTISIVPNTKDLPRQIPLTQYGGGADGGFECALVRDETSFGQWYFETDENGVDHGAVFTGTILCFQLKQGYTIQVQKGGKIIRKGSFPYPTLDRSLPSVDIRVDDDAEELVYAIVKQGETFQFPDTSAARAGTSSQAAGKFTDVKAGVWYESPVMSAYERGIVKGVTESMFCPNSATTRGQTVTMLYRAMGSPGGSNVFSDTSGEVGSAAGWASANGVTNGVSATAFAPNSSITREQLVTMLYRMAGSPSADTSALASFTDGGSVHGYARSAVAWAIGRGLLTGYGDGTIRPAGVATRAEVCTIIMRYLG